MAHPREDKTKDPHLEMMGDETEEQNLDQKGDPKQAPSSKDFKNWDGSRAAICNSNITGRAVMPTAFKPPRKRLFQLPWRSLSLAPLPLWPHY